MGSNPERHAVTDPSPLSLTPVGDYLRKRYPPNDGATHYIGNDGDPGCCAGPHPPCLYAAAFREGERTEQSRAGTVTRVEVIDETGRAMTRYDVQAELSYQDGDRTLKVYLKPRDGSAGDS